MVEALTFAQTGPHPEGYSLMVLRPKKEPEVLKAGISLAEAQELFIIESEKRIMTGTQVYGLANGSDNKRKRSRKRVGVGDGTQGVEKPQADA